VADRLGKQGKKDAPGFRELKYGNKKVRYLEKSITRHR
jgi:hypothetical protein